VRWPILRQELIKDDKLWLPQIAKV